MTVGANITRLRGFAGDFLRTSPSRGAWPLLLAFAGAASEGIGLMLLVPIITVLGEAPLHGASAGGSVISRFIAYLPAGKPAQLTVLVTLFGALMLLRAGVSVARDVSFARLSSTFPEQIRIRVLDHLITAGWGKIAGLHHARVTHLLSGDFQTCALAGTSFINLCLSSVMLATLLTVALILSPVLASIAIVLLIMLAAALFPTLAAARQSGTALVEIGVMLTSDLGQLLAGLKPALGNNLGKDILAHIARLQRDQTRQLVAFARQQSRSRAAVTLAAGAIGALALLVGGLLLNVEGPLLFAMLVILARVAGPALQFQQSLQILFHTLPTYEKIKALENDLGSGMVEAKGAPTVPLPSGAVTLDEVTYLHAANSEKSGGVLALSLVLEPGSLVAIVGPSGAGKTTLADLLAGLILPQGGSIRIGCAALEPGNTGQWQNEIGYVPQDSFLLNDTIRNNLLWGNRHATEEDLRAALQTAEADSFVNARAGGLDAPVGERGILLSGGERQRIALARALLRRPRLLLLDEATNALDPETEQRILARFGAMANRPTIVAISHRTTAIDHFDSIYQLRGGRLISSDDETPC